MGLSLEHLLRLRLAIARFGEMDLARWWNSRGVLGHLGRLAYARGFPRAHLMAQARVALTIAESRCNAVFNPPDCLTLWDLGSSVEDDFASQWVAWVEEAERLAPFFTALEQADSTDLLGFLLKLDLLDDGLVREAGRLRRAADNRAVLLPGAHAACDRTASLLAAGFFRGEPGKPAIPYAKAEG